MKTLAITLLLLVNSAFAGRIYDLQNEANEALSHISHCTSELGKALTDGAWIGRTQKWESRNRNYGYTFHIFNTDWSDFSTFKVGEVRLLGKHIPLPPQDGSSYKYSCTFTAQ